MIGSSVKDLIRFSITWKMFITFFFNYTIHNISIIQLIHPTFAYIRDIHCYALSFRRSKQDCKDTRSLHSFVLFCALHTRKFFEKSVSFDLLLSETRRIANVFSLCVCFGLASNEHTLTRPRSLQGSLKAAFHPCVNVYIYKPINRPE